MVKKVAQCNSLVASTPRVGPIELPDPRVQAIDNKNVAMTDMIKNIAPPVRKVNWPKTNIVVVADVSENTML